MPGQHAEILVEVLPQIITLERRAAVLTANHGWFQPVESLSGICSGAQESGQEASFEVGRYGFGPEFVSTQHGIFVGVLEDGKRSKHQRAVFLGRRPSQRPDCLRLCGSETISGCGTSKHLMRR